MIENSAYQYADIMNIKVEPSDKLFVELGNNTYNYVDLISELIDNSIAAKDEAGILTVTIEVGISESNPKQSYFLIRDNAKGIQRKLLGQAISPAANSGGKTLNEHGLGMKQSVASMGVLKYLATKTKTDQEAIMIEEFKFGDIKAKFVGVEWEQGTELCVTDLKEIVPFKSERITKSVIPFLGARYRRFLNINNPQMKIIYRLLDLDAKENGEDSLVNEWEVKEVKPIYFHPNKRTNEPLVKKIPLKGVGWKAELTMGYAPKDEEYEEMGLKKPKVYNPYHVSMNKQGFDIIKNDRIIKFHQLSELRIVEAKHPSLNFIRGEIDLIKGFTTSITKDNIIVDKHVWEMVDQIKEHVAKGKLFEKKNYPSEIPESLLRDRLVHHFKNNTLNPKTNVYTEYAVEGMGGFIDIRTDEEIWELKTHEATGLDVYQLFGYLDMNTDDVKAGYLVAPGFKTGAQKVCDNINKKHDVTIKLIHTSEFPINHPPTQEETKKYIKNT